MISTSFLYDLSPKIEHIYSSLENEAMSGRGDGGGLEKVVVVEVTNTLGR